MDFNIPCFKLGLVNWKRCKYFPTWDVKIQGCLGFWSKWTFVVECGCGEIYIKTCKTYELFQDGSKLGSQMKKFFETRKKSV